MVNMIIKNIGKFNLYTLLDEKTQTQQTFTLEFFDGVSPKVNDKLIMPDSLIDSTSRDYANMYRLRKMDNECGKLKPMPNEIITLCTEQEEIVLKRIYG